MRLIDADALVKQIESPYTEYSIMIHLRRAIKDFIDSAPTIDAFEVVRCGECMHKYMKDFDMFCPHMVGIIKPNMHCSYGEKVKP